MDFDEQLCERGWCRIPSTVPAGFLDCLSRGLDAAYAEQRRLQVRNGVEERTDGTVHHLPCEDGVFLEFLERLDGLAPLDRFFDGPYILNTYGGLLHLPGDVWYVGRVHRDQRTYSGDVRLMAQLLVMIDDFTEENGATYFLDGSHRLPHRPSDDEFFGHASRAISPAGCIVLFNSNLWHAAGVNRSAQPRRALTLGFTKPFVKQQLDYPRALGYERAASMSPVLRQMLGYNARVPTSLDEWYQPPEKRLYQRDQG